MEDNKLKKSFTPLMDVIERINANPELKKIQNDGYEFILEDRLAKIRAINEQYDLEHNAYIAFSGGKDSCVVSHLVDLALPNNTIPRVYVNTGIEYVDMVKFVKNKAKNDSRIIIINNKLNIKKTLTEKGYPFKSKEHSRKVSTFYNNQDSVLAMVAEFKNKTLDEINAEFEEKWHHKRAIDVALMMIGLTYNKKLKRVQSKNPRYLTPKILKYQFTKKLNNLDFKISDKCCLKFKEEPMLNYAKESGRAVAITGLMREEKGRRITTLCTAFNKKTGKLKSFAPLAVITKEWENEFVERENISLCKLYSAPFNFERTGCKGCPFALGLQEQLDVMNELLPGEYKQCLHLWRPVYDEYIRIGYTKRLKEYPHNIIKKKYKKLF